MDLHEEYRLPLSGSAVVGLVLGVLGALTMLPLPGFALVLGLVGFCYGQDGRRHVRLGLRHGQGVAVAGQVTSGGAFTLALLTLIFS